MESSHQAITLLKKLISTASFSKQEENTFKILSEFLRENHISFQSYMNNIWCQNKYFDPALPTVLLNSHHDTVKPNEGYTNDPFDAKEEDGKLFGLGSNDAGGPLVCLLLTFIKLYATKLPFNLVFAGTAEEEISGKNGIAAILSKMPPIHFGIVGEPTEMKMAIAEKGLVVIDCTVYGEAGHAARKNGKNAIELALPDLEILKDFQFEKKSNMLGEINLSVTQINAGKQHNVIPDRCDFVLDVRTTDAYTNEEVVALIDQALVAEVKPRSTRLQPSGIDTEHPLFISAKKLGIDTYGSPTLSDQALMPFPTIKMGPGKSERSHTADEYIYLDEITDGLIGYEKILKNLKV